MQKVKKTTGYVLSGLCMVFFLLFSGGQDVMAQKAVNISLRLEKVTVKDFFGCSGTAVWIELHLRCKSA